MDDIAVLADGVSFITPADGLEKKLKESQEHKRPLRVKLGCDPTSPDLHLGHAVVLKKLKQFQDLGHQVVLIIGDVTACIGDPTGKNKTRPPLSSEQVQQNAQTYVHQVSKILDIQQTEIRYQTEWFQNFSLQSMIRILSQVTVAQLLTRDDFHKRYTAGSAIGMHEMLYPILQGYDSLVVQADIEMGGTDQLFNCLLGRHLQEHVYPQMSPQIVVSMPLLVGLDGKEKMSKSYKNYIGLTDIPQDMYGKVMSIPDHLIESYLTLVTDFTLGQRQTYLQEILHPMELKKKIAHNVVKQYYDVLLADESAQFFYNQFQSKKNDLKQYVEIAAKQVFQKPQMSLLEICAALLPEQSRSALRRLILSQAVSVNHEKKQDPSEALNENQIPYLIKIGKRHFFKIC